MYIETWRGGDVIQVLSCLLAITPDVKEVIPDGDLRAVTLIEFSCLY
jgi:hypothetical protein